MACMHLHAIVSGAPITLHDPWAKEVLMMILDDVHRALKSREEHQCV